jgi:hypothetical protein
LGTFFYHVIFSGAIFALVEGYHHWVDSGEWNFLFYFIFLKKFPLLFSWPPIIGDFVKSEGIRKFSRKKNAIPIALFIRVNMCLEVLNIFIMALITC